MPDEPENSGEVYEFTLGEYDADERIDRSLDKLLHEEAVETARDDRDLQSLCGELSVDFFHRFHLSLGKTARILSNNGEYVKCDHRRD